MNHFSCIPGFSPTDSSKRETALRHTGKSDVLLMDRQVGDVRYQDIVGKGEALIRRGY